jgi:hypothetical protein
VSLEQFLVKAKLNAYAGEGEGGEGVLPDGSKEFTFEEGDFSYRDRYFGWNPFVGEEVVWEGNQVVWSMNYYGRVIDDVVPAAEVYSFLQRAMNQVKTDRPFRGPSSLNEGEFEYRDESHGTIDQFTGIERIFYRGREIYRLNYHGGSVKSI